MKTLNKSLLAAATVSALALSGVASAAVLSYPAGTQITYARDLFPLPANTVQLPDGFRVRATLPSEATALGKLVTNVNPNDPCLAVTPHTCTFTAFSRVRVQITLGGAVFSNTYATADQLAETLLLGAQLGGAPVGVAIGPGNSFNASFSSDRDELTFDVDLLGPGTPGGPTDFAIGFPLGVELVGMDGSLGAGGDVAVNVSIRAISTPLTAAVVGPPAFPAIVANAGIGPVVSGSGTLAKSQWGLRLLQNATFNQPPADQNKTIDVGSLPNRYTRFSPSGAIGDSNPPPGSAGSLYYNAGGFQLDVSEVTGVIPTKVLDATALSQYSVNTAATYQVTVTGDNLSPWAAPNTTQIWLTTNATCAAPINNTYILTVNPITNTATSGNISTNDPAFFNITNTSPPSVTPTIYVCFEANSTTALAPQTSLSGTVQPTYNLALQRQLPPAMPFQLAPIEMNGEVLTFQNVNPGNNQRANSFLRLTNHNAVACPVTIDAKNDRGQLSDPVSVTLAPHASEQFDIDALEIGVDNQSLPPLNRPSRFNTSLLGGTPMVAGSKWYVRVLFECTNVAGSAWNRDRNEGTVRNLTAEKGVGASWSTPTTKINP